jgi:hypothetical protein
MAESEISEPSGQAGLRLTALPIVDLVRLLSRAGPRPVDEETVRRDIESGAPVNADGTVNLVHYAAWLVREVSPRGD